jgi:hypothetical protein
VKILFAGILASTKNGQILFDRFLARNISPYGDAILKKLKLSVIACTNYFQLICLLKDL